MDERIKFFVVWMPQGQALQWWLASGAGACPVRWHDRPDVRVLLKMLAKAATPAQVSVVYAGWSDRLLAVRELCRGGTDARSWPIVIPVEPAIGSRTIGATVRAWLSSPMG